MARKSKHAATLPRLIAVPVPCSQMAESALWDAAEYMASYHRRPHLAKIAHLDRDMAVRNSEYYAASARIHALAKTSPPGSVVVLWAADHAAERRTLMLALVDEMNAHLLHHRATDTLIELRDIRDRAQRVASDLTRLLHASESSPVVATASG